MMIGILALMSHKERTIHISSGSKSYGGRSTEIIQGDSGQQAVQGTDPEQGGRDQVLQ